MRLLLMMMIASLMHPCSNSPRAGIMTAFDFHPVVIAEAEVERVTSPEKPNEKDVDLLARLIYAEGGNAKETEWLYYYGSVVLNRVESNEFPDSIREVIYQDNPLQYACSKDGGLDKQPTDICYEVAEDLLESGSTIPEDVVWQAEFVQGSVWKQCGRTYFCHRR